MAERAGILDSFWYLVPPASAEVALSIRADKTLEHRADNAPGRGLSRDIDRQWCWGVSAKQRKRQH